MRVLYVTGALPYPLTSGRLRHYFLIRELARSHAVSLLALSAGGAPREHVAELERLAAVRLENVRQALPDRAARVMGWAGPATRRLGAEIKGFVAAGAADVVLLAGRPPLAVLPDLAGRVPLVVDICDAETLHLEHRLRVAGGRERPRLWARYLVARRRERTIVRLSDATLFATARDRDAVLGKSPIGEVARGVVLPNGVDLDQWHRRQRHLGSEVAFSGAMNYAANADAAVHLVDHIFPLVRATLPDARLRIIGRDPLPAVLARAGSPGVTVTGFVEDMRSHLEAAAVFVAPLRYGAGIQNKLLEAMAMELPCVASPLAAAGLESRDGARPPIDVASNPDEFASAIVNRLEAARRDPAPDSAARTYVAENFSWASAGRILEQTLDRAGQAEPPRRRR